MYWNMKPERIQDNLMPELGWLAIPQSREIAFACGSFGEASHLGNHFVHLAKSVGAERSLKLSIDEAHRLTVKVFAATPDAGLDEAETRLIEKIDAAVDNLYSGLDVS